MNLHVATAAGVLYRFSNETFDVDQKNIDRKDRARSLVLIKMIDFINHASDDRITLQDLERVAGRTRYQIIRIFQREIGETPHKYIMRRRLHEAQTMIARGEPVAEIAAELGFVDQSHLIRRFKSVFGMTPQSYARRAAHSDGRPGEAAQAGGRRRRQ